MSLLKKMTKNGKKSAKKKENYGAQEFQIDSMNRVVLNSKGLVPVILQDVITEDVLHLGYMDRWALDTTLEKKVVYLYRRSSSKVEKYGEKKDLEYSVKYFKLDRARRAILLKVLCISEDEDMRTSFSNDVELMVNA